MDDLISKLSEIRSEYNCFAEDEEPYYRALSEAIRILSRRVDDDTISRQVALEVFNDKIDLPNDERVIKSVESYLQRIYDKIKSLPSAEPEQRWIPCSERLPEEDTEVIVSCTDDSGDSEFSYTTTGWHYKGIWVVGNERSCFVKAWMPLPESYRE